MKLLPVHVSAVLGLDQGSPAMPQPSVAVRSPMVARAAAALGHTDLRAAEVAVSDSGRYHWR